MNKIMCQVNYSHLTLSFTDLWTYFELLDIFPVLPPGYKTSVLRSSHLAFFLTSALSTSVKYCQTGDLRLFSAMLEKERK